MLAVQMQYYLRYVMISSRRMGMRSWVMKPQKKHSGRQHYQFYVILATNLCNVQDGFFIFIFCNKYMIILFEGCLGSFDSFCGSHTGCVFIGQWLDLVSLGQSSLVLTPNGLSVGQYSSIFSQAKDNIMSDGNNKFYKINIFVYYRQIYLLGLAYSNLNIFLTCIHIRFLG